MNGARNRSNIFFLDGANDLNTLSGTYNYAPIVDAIQEFKSQGHNDLAEYGGAAGAAVSVVTKSGTNQYHGALWEFLRNEVMDSRGYFEQACAPLRQNQYGASAGGPLSIPKLYNGKNRTFFYVAWKATGTFQERNRSPGANGRNGAGDSADFRVGVPSTTRRQRLAAAASTRAKASPRSTTKGRQHGFVQRRHQLHPKQPVQPISKLFLPLIPTGSATVVNGENNFYPQNSDATQNSGTLRVDQNFGNNNQVNFRYSQFDLFKTNPSDTLAAPSCTSPAITTSGTGRTSIAQPPSRTCTSAETGALPPPVLLDG